MSDTRLSTAMQQAREDLTRAEHAYARAREQLNAARTHAKAAHTAWRRDVLLNGTCEEIAAALGIAMCSVRPARCRLRKQLKTTTQEPTAT